MILEEFDLEVVSVKLKKSLIFAELILDFPSVEEQEVYKDTFFDENIFIISTLDPWGYHYIFANVEVPYSPFTG